MAEIVDLRSDTVTRPTAAMRRAMAEARVGDDVYGEDPTVDELEKRVADVVGKEAALFVPSGTQSNLIALLCHCGRGDEYLVGEDAHTYLFEGGGAAVLGSIQPQPIPFEADATFDLDRVARAIKPDDVHFARTRLLCLENTHHGQVLPRDYVARAAALAGEHSLAFHLDGARLWNAAIALGVAVNELTGPFDSVSVCLSKGLGAPVGSVLCASRELIAEARRWRKLLGGGMRQAGVLAAAGLVAVDQHLDRLADDHANARRLADGLEAIGDLEVAPAATNMVFVGVAGGDDRRADLRDHLDTAGVLTGEHDGRLRLVTHLDVDAAAIDRAVAAFADFFAR